jgi:hypothetical protein
MAAAVASTGGGSPDVRSCFDRRMLLSAAGFSGSQLLTREVLAAAAAW